MVKGNKEKTHKQMLGDIRKFGKQFSCAFWIDRNGFDKKIRQIRRVKIKEIQGKTDKRERQNKNSDIF